jgi:hypothetical protein
MTLTVRDDEVQLLNHLKRATALGELQSRKPRGNARAQLAWVIGRKSDCLRLTEILDTHSVRGQKSGDYALWRAAIRWWVAGDPTRRKKDRDWSAMAYLKGQLSECRQYVPRGRPLLDSGPLGLTDDWGWFFSGFTTAERHLGISKNGQYLAPKFQIAVREDDSPLLLEIRRRTGGLGRMYTDRSATRRHPVAVWLIRSGDDLERIVAVLDRFTPKGRRGLEYQVWREAAMAYGEPGPRKRVQRRLSRLQWQLATARRYRPPQFIDGSVGIREIRV